MRSNAHEMAGLINLRAICWLLQSQQRKCHQRYCKRILPPPGSSLSLSRIQGPVLTYSMRVVIVIQISFQIYDLSGIYFHALANCKISEPNKKNCKLLWNKIGENYREKYILPPWP